MKFSKYVFDKWLEILFALFGYFTSLMMLFAFKISKEVIIGITVVFLLFFITSGFYFPNSSFNIFIASEARFL